MLLRLCLTVLFSVVLYWDEASAAESGRVMIEDLRSWQAPDHTRLVFDLSSKTEHSLFMLQNPERLVIDIDNARLVKTDIIKANLNMPVTGIRHGNHGESLRLVVDLNYKIHARSFLLEPNESYGYRLMIDMYGADKKTSSTVQIASDIMNSDKQRDAIVVIDAGHGGDDVGAVGISGIYEKDVVLDYAIMIKDALDKINGISARLTRSSDYFIGLRRRTQIAREHKADLFVSVHANSLHNSPDTRGFMIFALSSKGATSEMGKLLAKYENRSDVIGGSYNLSLVDKSRDLRKVLLDLSLTSVINNSILAGQSILKSVGSYVQVHTGYVEQAAFIVLKSSATPALLIELGFLSNPKEEKLLVNRQYRRNLVLQIKGGIVDYLNMYPPYGTFFAASKSPDEDVYVVSSGDTLGEIAERHAIKTEDLRRINNIRGNTIIIGQKLYLRIPDSDLTLADESGNNFYLVKSGDTLGEIAERHAIKTEDLRRINNIRGNTIIIGQKLYLRIPDSDLTLTDELGNNFYLVKSGDTLGEIAERHAIKTEDLRRINNVRGNTIIIGQKLYLRASDSDLTLADESDNNFYLVKSGDTLGEIAERHAIKTEDLRRINNIRGNTIIIGQKLYLRISDSDLTLADKASNNFYLVKSGDTLGAIAEELNININKLRAFNDISGSNIRSGQKLWLSESRQ